MMDDKAAEREKLLKKIQKCLNLSKSSNPNEAAAALRQAQKMMQLHSIDEAELLGIEVTSTLVITPEPHKQKIPLYMAFLTGTVSTAFEVTAFIETAFVNGKPRLAVRYFGPMGRSQLAQYAHEVMWRQMMGSWNKYRADRPHIANVLGGRMGFWVGWLQQVRHKVVDFGGREEEREVTRKAARKYYEREHGITEDFKASKCNETLKLDQSSRFAGAEAAGDFSIHRPVNGSVSDTTLLN